MYNKTFQAIVNEKNEVVVAIDTISKDEAKEILKDNPNYKVTYLPVVA